MTDRDTPQPLDTHDRARCAVVARRMDAAQVLGLLGLACTGVMLLCMAAGAWRNEDLVFALATALLGMVERYFALRLRLDAGLFADLASGRIADLAALDTGLAAIGVRASAPTHPPRPLDARIAGGRRLWRWHLAVVLVQAAMTLLAVVSS
ncbi:hypothetical protein [Lysobacter brunescens]|uniref:Transmembrane protein n=1 Tax=Lysobacter brunescens TaxID=262323 RepID=A0ABW2YAM3_9GAMM